MTNLMYHKFNNCKGTVTIKGRLKMYVPAYKYTCM